MECKDIILQNYIHRKKGVDDKKEKVEDEEEDDSQTIFAVLSILENITEIDSDFCIEIIKQCKLFKILLNGMRKKQEFGKKFDEIQLYLSELLCIYLQPMDDVIYQRFAEIKGCDKVLDLLNNKYLKHDPTLSEEKEYVSNLINALSTSLASITNQNKFNSSPSAMKILLNLIKQKNYLKMGCIEALSFALTNHEGNCIKFIQNDGLKTIFAEFMNGKNIKKKYKKIHNKDKMEEYICCILVHLFCNLSDLNLLRLMNKFREKEYSKIDRLIELHTKYMTNLEDNDLKERESRIKNEIEKETFGEKYSRRLENGLYTLQMIDLLIGFVYTSFDNNDNNIKHRIIHVLNQYDMDIDQVKLILNQYYQVTHSDDDDNHPDDMSLGSIAARIVTLM